MTLDGGRHVRSANQEPASEVGENNVEQLGPGLELVIDDRDASPSDRYGAECYLVTQVLRMLGSADSDVDTLAQPSGLTGLALITLEDDEPSAAETLAKMVERDEPFRSGSVDRGLRAVLGGRISAWRLHGWLTNSFFDHHVELSAGNPVVWHLSTRSGAFQVLVRADQLAPERLKVIQGWARMTQGRLGRSLADAGLTGDLDLVESIRIQLDEVGSFESLLVEMARNGWRVGGDLDRAAKLAVLRSRGAVPPTPPSRVR